jgi:hypothetical protein
MHASMNDILTLTFLQNSISGLTKTTTLNKRLHAYQGIFLPVNLRRNPAMHLTGSADSLFKTGMINVMKFLRVLKFSGP